MVAVRALTSLYGREGKFLQGQEFEATETRANELIRLGLVEEVGKATGAAAAKPADFRKSTKTKPAKDAPETK